jgi:hypothetical protein
VFKYEAGWTCVLQLHVEDSVSDAGGCLVRRGPKEFYDHVAFNLEDVVGVCKVINQVLRRSAPVTLQAVRGAVIVSLDLRLEVAGRFMNLSVTK